MNEYTLDSIIDDPAVLKSMKRHCMKTALGQTYYERMYNAVEMILPIAKDYEDMKIQEAIYLTQ